MRRSTRTSTRTTELPCAKRLPSPAESRLRLSRCSIESPFIDGANPSSVPANDGCVDDDSSRSQDGDGVRTLVHESHWLPPKYPKPELPSEESSESPLASPLASPHDDETSAALSRPSVAAFYADEGRVPLPEALQRPSVAAYYDDHGAGIQGSGSSLVPDALRRLSVAAFYSVGDEADGATAEAPNGEETHESEQLNAGIAQPARLLPRLGAPRQVPPARLPAPNTHAGYGCDNNSGVSRPARLPPRDRAGPLPSTPGLSTPASDESDGHAGGSQPARLPSRRRKEDNLACDAQGEPTAMSTLVQIIEEHEAGQTAREVGEHPSHSRPRRQNKGSRKLSVMSLAETMAETEAPQRVRI